MRQIISSFLAAMVLFTAPACTQAQTKPEASMIYDGVYPQHEPYGTGIGAMPGRVVWAHDPDSVDWDGEGYWWQPDNFDEAAIRRMVDDSIASLGGKDSAKEGWAALFQAHNGGSGYAAGEKIAIKANINGSGVNDDDSSGRTRMSYTNPVLLKALLTSLVKDAGAAPSDITVYDVSRLFPDYDGLYPLQAGLRREPQDIYPNQDPAGPDHPGGALPGRLCSLRVPAR